MRFKSNNLYLDNSKNKNDKCIILYILEKSLHGIFNNLEIYTLLKIQTCQFSFQEKSVNMLDYFNKEIFHYIVQRVLRISGALFCSFLSMDTPKLWSVTCGGLLVTKFQQMVLQLFGQGVAHNTKLIQSLQPFSFDQHFSKLGNWLKISLGFGSRP